MNKRSVVEKLVLPTMCIIALAMPASAQWTKQTGDVYSPSFQESRYMVVCLPPGYDQSRAEPYSVFLILGGGYPSFNCNEQDGFTEQDLEPPLIVGLTGEEASSASSILSWNQLGNPWVNSTLLGPLEDYVFDMIAHVDSSFNTYGTAEKRAIRGSSITGGGGARMGLKYHESFAALMADNGFPDLGFVFDPQGQGPPGSQGNFRDGVLREHSGPPYSFSPTGFATPFGFRLASAFTPNMSNPPYFVDFFLDVQGEIIEWVKTDWLNSHGTRYARDLPPSADIKLWIDYRPGDDVGADFSSIAFMDSLDALGIVYEHMTHDCGHGGPCTDKQKLRRARSMFLALAMNQPALSVSAQNQVQPYGFTLHQNYPNPFNPTTSISFDLAHPEHTRLSVYNVIGQEVARLLDKQLPASNHEVSWDASGLPTGLYFYTLTAGDFSETKTMLLVK